MRTNGPNYWKFRITAVPFLCKILRKPSIAFRQLKRQKPESFSPKARFALSDIGQIQLTDWSTMSFPKHDARGAYLTFCVRHVKIHSLIRRLRPEKKR